MYIHIPSFSTEKEAKAAARKGGLCFGLRSEDRRWYVGSYDQLLAVRVDPNTELAIKKTFLVRATVEVQVYVDAFGQTDAHRKAINLPAGAWHLLSQDPPRKIDSVAEFKTK